MSTTTDPARGTIVAHHDDEGNLNAGIVIRCEEGNPVTGEDRWTLLLENGDIVEADAGWCYVIDQERCDELRHALSRHDEGDVPPAKLTGEGYEVTITRSGGADGAVVIFVDGPNEGHREQDERSDGSPGCRIRLNDEPVYVGTPYEPKEDE